MMRFLSLVIQLIMFWLPLAVALLMLGVAMWKGSPGMGILAVVVALVAGLYRYIMTAASRGADQEQRR